MAKYQRKSEAPQIIFYQDWNDIFSAFSDSEVGYIVKGIYAHRLGNEYQSSGSPIVDAMLSFLNSQCDKNKEEYMQRCARNAENRAKQERKQQITTVDDGQPQSTMVDDGQPQSTMVDLYKNRNNDKNKNKNDIDISFSSNEEKGSEKETKEEDGCQDAGAASSVDPTTERGNPNFDLRKSYLAIKKRKAENRLKTGEYI